MLISLDDIKYFKCLVMNDLNGDHNFDSYPCRKATK